MQPARLRETLIFERKSVDSANQTTWGEHFRTRGEYRPIAATPVQDNMDGTIISRITAQFIIRYRSDVSSTSHRIRFAEKIWNILEPIQDPKYRLLTIDASWIDPPAPDA
jgi:head-tail adaptor